MITPLGIIAALLVFIWGWYIRKWFFQAAAQSKPLRMTVLVVNGTCLAILAVAFIWHILH